MRLTADDKISRPDDYFFIFFCFPLDKSTCHVSKLGRMKKVYS